MMINHEIGGAHFSDEPVLSLLLIGIKLVSQDCQYTFFV